MIPRLKAKVEDGNLKYSEPARLVQYLNRLEGKGVYVSISEDRPQRSINQNSYYWGVPLEMISEHTGHTPEEVHELLKGIFLKKYVSVSTKYGKQQFEIIGSTKLLNTKEMEKYLENVRNWASLFLNLSIPEPNEVEF